MRIGNRIYYFENGEMKLLSNVEQTFNIYSFREPIIKWYRKNPYAKRINQKWICKDYRIDQQRPKRNVYSEAYLKIIEITEIEERHLTDLIKKLEENINYPKVIFDNGKEYVIDEKIKKEEKIKCEEKMIKVEKIHCSKCGMLIHNEDNYCCYCGEKQESRICKKCGSKINGNYCSECGEKL